MSDRQLPDGLRRLNKLADLLETQPPKEFTLSTWSCGFACCAVGFAASHPYFTAEGLGLALAPQVSPTKSYHPTYDFSESWGAVERFFELNDDEARSLFDPSCYCMNSWSDPRPVVMRIRAMVEQKTALLLPAANV